MICAGIDAGSRAIKVALLNSETLETIGTAVTDQGVRQAQLASQLLDRALAEANLTRERISRTVATGYGRDQVDSADTTVTEITCHALGVHHVVPDARTIIDIGGQDSKLLRLEENGRVRDFVMNDRCAAGTGRFLEVVASRLGVQLNDLGDMAHHAEKPASISSMCVVFAETEIIGLLASGETPANIAAGIQASIAGRVASMGGRSLADPICFTGGVAMVAGMARALETATGHSIIVAPSPQLTGAIGAALIACRQASPSQKTTGTKISWPPSFSRPLRNANSIMN